MIQQSRQHANGQGLVEFALLLPVLMLVTMGIFDFGRVMIAYSTMSNSVREAARYAELYDADNPEDSPYLDCATISGLASRVTFGGPVTVTIQHIPVTGSGTTETPFTNCSGVDDDDLQNGDILLIQASTSVQLFTPVVSNLFPVFPLKFVAQRTIAKDLMLGIESDDENEEDDCTGTGSGSSRVLCINDVTVNEDAGTATFTVTLSPGGNPAVTVKWSTANDTATSGSDYTGSTWQNITFTPGETSETVTVPITNDTADEPDEIFYVDIEHENTSNPNNPTIVKARGIGTIVDNDEPPPPQLSIEAAKTVGESDGTVTFNVTLSASSTQTVTVQYATANGSATAGSDYMASSNTLTFTPGDTSETITVNITNDGMDEPDETFTVTLSSPTNATIAAAQGTATITDNDAAPAFSISDVSFSEGNSGDTNFVFTVSVVGTSYQAITVNYAASPGTASNGSDYNPTSGSLTFPAGSSASQTITVPVKGDTNVEPDETFTVTLSGQTGGSTLTDGSGTGTILNDDSTTPQLRVAPATYTVGESAGTVTITLTMSPTKPTSTSVTATMTTGTAGSSDFNTTTQNLTFPANAPSMNFTIPITSDTLDEADETFTLTISAAAVTVAAPTATVTITDDDNPPTISINDTTITEGNSGTQNLNFTVTLSALSGKTITVQYSTAGNTAGSSDFTAISGATLTFNPGDPISKTITVQIAGDTLSEANETFNVNLTSPTNATLADSQGIGTITDNDPLPALTFSDLTVSESVGNAVVNVTFSPAVASGQVVSVQYITNSGTALAGSSNDYMTTSGTLTFVIGDTSKPITIPIVNDTKDEVNETFTLTLSSPSGATLPVATRTITITDEDNPPTLSINDVTVTEAAGTASFTVTLSTASGQIVTVAYATANGTATAGSDYTAASGTLTFNPDEITKTISVPITDDTSTDSSTNETFVVNLTSPTNATISDSQGTGTIQDNETGPIKLQVQNLQWGGQQMVIFFRIVNNSGTAIPWNQLKVRYYFTRDGATLNAPSCNNPWYVCNNDTWSYGTISGMDYIEINFANTPSSWTIAAGTTSDVVEYVINGSSNFTRPGDYSFDPAVYNVYNDAPKMTLYYQNGTLIWGTPP